MKILELGSGKKPYEQEGNEVIHLDKVKLPHIEAVHDLNKFPYPFEDCEFDVVIAKHVLEHLDDLSNVMKEIWRILKPNGILKVVVPYYAFHTSFCDPTHKHFFTYETFDFWDSTTFFGKQSSHEVGNIKFKIIRRKFIFSRPLKFLESFANAFPIVYEHLFSRIFPAIELEFELIKI